MNRIMTTCSVALRIMLTCVCIGSLTSLASAAEQPQRTRRVLYNFDGDSCLSTKAGSKGPVAVNADDVKRLIEEVAYNGSLVDTVLVCINAQVMYYPTQVGTMRGTLSTPDEQAKWPPSEKQRFENLKAFFDSGVDPYAIMLAETRRRGREALLTFRMNDDHGNDFLRTQFLTEHPDWRLGTEQYKGSGAMDFGRDEVREYTFRLIEEAVRRYDSDGLELDFNRFPTFFKDGSTDERVGKMNSLVERVRRMLDEVGLERGRRLVLAVRVPSNYGRTPPTPETARELGCDVPAWVKSGWVDFVTVSEFLLERGDLPIDAWKQAVTSVPVYGGIECTRGGGAKNLTADEYRAAATHLIKSGSDGVYLFNFFTSREEGANAYEPPFEVLRDLGPLKVGLRRQLFVDDFVVADKQHVTRELGQVSKLNDGKPIFTDGWFYGTVLHDDDKFKLWFRKPGTNGFGFDTTRLSLWKWCRLRGAGQGRTHAPSLAGEGRDKPLAAARAESACESKAEDAALEVTAEFLLNKGRHGPLGTVATSEPVLEVLGDDPVERSLLGAATLVAACRRGAGMRPEAGPRGKRGGGSDHGQTGAGAVYVIARTQCCRRPGCERAAGNAVAPGRSTFPS